MSEEDEIDQELKISETPEVKPDVIAQEAPVENQTNNMEVFHHPDLHHNKKQWKEYIIEFLMIFLAVTLGFFAENLREYISDNHHVRQLASQLIIDLKNDSAILNNNIEREKILIKKADSLYFILQQSSASIDLKKAQELIIACYNINLFQPSSGAMLAVKTELHLKQFANSDIALRISNYETDQALLKTVEQFQEANLKEYLQGFMTSHFSPANAYTSLTYGTIANRDMRNITTNELTQLSVDIMFIKNYNALLADKSEQLKNNASEFIHYLNKEFQ